MGGVCVHKCVCIQGRTTRVQVAGWELSGGFCDAGACVCCPCCMFCGACDWWVCTMAGVCWGAHLGVENTVKAEGDCGLWLVMS